MPRVIVSSGHTSQNPGVVANGLSEYEVARKIAKYALKYIRINGLISLSTPPNLELAQRIEWINKTGYAKATNDIAIEIHINDGGKRGIEGWYEGEGNSPSLEITSKIVEAICQETNLPDQGIKSEFQHELGSISFVHEVYPIGCVIECGYIDNLEDSEFLKEEKNLEIMGKGLAKGVLKYFNLDFREVVVPQVPVTPEPQPVIAQPQTPVIQPAVKPYDTKLETQTDDYDKDDFDPDLDDDEFYDIDEEDQSKDNVKAPTPTPVYQPPQPTPGYQAPYTPGAYTPPQQQGYTPLPSREERKQMIINNYAKILGREPNQNDLNYFLNIGIREDELIKKMMESQEHVDLVKAKQELISLKEEHQRSVNELNDLKAQTEDSQGIIENLHGSIDQKNVALTQLQYEIKELQLKLLNAPKGVLHSSSKKYEGNFMDKVFKAISDILD